MSNEAKYWKGLYEKERKNHKKEMENKEAEIFSLRVDQARLCVRIYDLLESKGISAKEIMKISKGIENV